MGWPTVPKYLLSSLLQKTVAHHGNIDSIIWSISHVEKENSRDAATCSTNKGKKWLLQTTYERVLCTGGFLKGFGSIESTEELNSSFSAHKSGNDQLFYFKQKALIYL